MPLVAVRRLGSAVVPISMMTLGSNLSEGPGEKMDPTPIAAMFAVRCVQEGPYLFPLPVLWPPCLQRAWVCTYFLISFFIIIAEGIPPPSVEGGPAQLVTILFFFT